MRTPSNRRARTTRRDKTDKAAQADKAGKRQEPRADLYDSVTQSIIAQLEAGRLPWVQPWGAVPGGAAPGLPRNARSGRPYSGINILILWGAVIEQGYPSQGWLTFKQALDAGGCVRKGEHGQSVVYADRFIPESEAARARESGTDARAICFLKRFTVFNAAQCDGLAADFAADPAPLPDREIVPVAEQVIAASGVRFRIGGDKAFYAPGPDTVQVPPQPAFFEQINYYRTALHELCHAVVVVDLELLQLVVNLQMQRDVRRADFLLGQLRNRAAHVLHDPLLDRGINGNPMILNHFGDFR